MVAPARPAFNISADRRTITYQSLDNTDEALYNSLQFQYERNAFLDAIQTRLNAIAAENDLDFDDGATIKALWDQRRRYLIKKWRKKKSPHAPVAIAEPPPVPVGLPAQDQHDQNQNDQNEDGSNHDDQVQDEPNEDAQGQNEGAESEEEQSSKSRDVTLQNPDSPGTPVPHSPPYVLYNDDIHAYPTRGERAQLQDYAKDNSWNDIGWKFARILYQSRFEGESGNRAQRAFHLEQSISLYVHHDANGLIENRLVCKSAEVSERDNLIRHDNEERINTLLSSTNCDHVLRFLGSSRRKMARSIRAHASNSANQIQQEVMQLYFEFAEHGDLEAVFRAHAEEKIPVPEHFVWYCLSQMVEALITLQTGICNNVPRENAEDASGADICSDDAAWEPLMHSDIKLENVFCCHDNTTYPSYPRPVLADFDIAQATKDGVDETDRYVGTSTWQPPERNEHVEDYDTYVPGRWEISEKADVWAVGLAAHKLLRASVHNGDTRDPYGIPENLARDWLDQFSIDTLETRRRQFNMPEDEDVPLGSLRDDYPVNFPSIYTVALISFVDHCLHYEPTKRPTLREMKAEIDRHVQRFDRLYGDEIKKSKDTISHDHEVRVDTKLMDFTPYVIGEEYQPPRKRRRIDISDGRGAAYRAVVTRWENTTIRPDPMTEARLVEIMEAELDRSQNEKIQMIYDEGSWYHSFKYLLSCLRYRVNKDDGTFDVVDNWEDDDVLNAFNEIEPRTEVLRRIRDYMIPDLLADKNYADLRDAIGVLQHVVDWSILLLNWKGEPNKPLLEKKTELHRGFRDWIFIHPHPNGKMGKPI